MNEQLRKLAEDRLRDAVPCPARDDVIEEITADLTEKYNELCAGGMEPDAAFAAVQEGIGDLSEIVAFINEANRRSEEEERKSADPFAELEKLIRQIGRQIQPSVSGLADDFKSAAGHLTDAARGIAREAKDPLREVAHSVRESVKDPLREMAHSVKESAKGAWQAAAERAGSRFRYDYTVPSAELNGVRVRTCSGDVTFGVSQDDNVYIVELSPSELTEDRLASVTAQDGVLTVAQGQKNSAGSLLFNYGVLSSDFEIYLPQRAWNLIEVCTTSGDIELDAEVEVASLSLRTTSGDLILPDLTCGRVEISTTSGDITATGAYQDLFISTVSGDLELQADCGALTVGTTSGDLRLRLKHMPSGLDLHTVSGDISLCLPDNDGFTLHYSRVSGDIRSDFDLRTSLNVREGTAVYLSGGANRNYSVKTVSGDLRIRRK